MKQLADWFRAERLTALLEFQKPVLIAAGFAVFVLFSYIIILRPQVVAWRLTHAARLLAVQNLERYRDFDKFIGKLDQQKERITAPALQEGLHKVVSDNLEQEFFLTMDTISDQVKVRVEKLTPTQLADGQKAWTVAFGGSFAQICQFLTLVERSFKVSNLVITSGQQVPRHGVEFTMVLLYAPLLTESVHNDVIDRFTGADMLVLYTEVERLLESVNVRRQRLPASGAVPVRDVLLQADTLYYTPPAPGARSAARAPAEERPPLSIDGIFWDPDVPVVVIDGKAVRVGDTVRGAKVLQIHEKSVVVKYKDKNYTLVK